MIGKRILAGAMVALLLAACPGLESCAEEGQEAPAAEGTEASQPEKTPEELAAEEEARKNAIYEIIPDSNNLPGWPEGPKVHAASAIVMDMESGAVLYAKAAEEQHFPASITKLLTTLVALETGEPDDTVTFSEDSISFLEPGDASIGMLVGEQLSLNDALHAVLLASANEVSYAVAENMGIKMGGTYQTFIDRMNERAIELGCTGSHWVNANGLHDDQHFTTAHDMARIAAAVYQYEPFQHLMGSLEYTIAPTSLKNEPRTCWQNHKMLWPENEYYYEFCRGGKTGYTDQSGTTLVTMADNGQMRLAAVVMADYGVQAYEDTRAMLDYAFGNFTKVTIADKETSGDIETFQDEGAYVVLPAGVDFTQLECQISTAEGEAETGNVSFDRWIEVLTAPPAPPEETPAEGEQPATDGSEPGQEGTDGTPAGAPADGAQPGAEGAADGSQPGAEGTADGSQPGAEGAPASADGAVPASAEGVQPGTDGTAPAGTDGAQPGTDGTQMEAGENGDASGNQGLSGTGENPNDASSGQDGADATSGTAGNKENDAGSGSERAGTIVYTYAGQEAGHAAVVLNQSYFGEGSEIEWTPADGSKRKSKETAPKKLGGLSARQMIIAGGAAVLLVVIVCAGMSRRKRTQERKRRNRKNNGIS